MTDFQCKNCGLVIQWVSAGGSYQPGRGFGYWHHPTRVELDETGMKCEDSDEMAEPFTHIVEIVCGNDHCWVPGTLVVNSAGEDYGQRLSSKFCPVCADTKLHIYREPLSFNPIEELALYEAWRKEEGV